MPKTITSVNSVYQLSISGLYTIPQQLQGFAADDVFDNESVEPVEVLMGVDGVMSAGFSFIPVKQTITLQADSDSVDIFETWYRAQVNQRDLYFASATITLPSISRSYHCNKGVLSGYHSFSDAKKVLQPRKFQITWERVTPRPI